MGVNNNVEVNGKTNITSVGTLVISGSVTLAGTPLYNDIASMGGNDKAAQTYIYRVWEFLDTAPILTAINGTGNSAGMLVGPHVDETNTTNTFTSDAAKHPGNLGVFTVASGQSSAWANIPQMFAPNAGVTYTLRYLFRTPLSASDDTNDYGLYVGSLTEQLTTAAGPSRGWGIYYRHSAAGGNWQIFATNLAWGVTTYVSTSVPFTPKAWQTLTITLPPTGNNVSMVLECSGVISSLGSISYGGMEAPVNAAVAGVGGISIHRNVTDTTTYRSAYLDRVSLYVSGLSW